MLRCRHQKNGLAEANPMLDLDGVTTINYTVPYGCLFVMGDNRNHSADSKYSNNEAIAHIPITHIRLDFMIFALLAWREYSNFTNLPVIKRCVGKYLSGSYSIRLCIFPMLSKMLTKPIPQTIG